MLLSIMDECKNAGVTLTGAGAAYPHGVNPMGSHIRIAPSFPPEEELKVVAALLCLCVKIATVEKLPKSETIV